MRRGSSELPGWQDSVQTKNFCFVRVLGALSHIGVANVEVYLGTSVSWPAAAHRAVSVTQQLLLHASP